MIVHFTSAAHDIAKSLVFVAVACAACNLFLFENVYALAAHLTVAHEKASGCKCCKSAADDIGAFLFDALRLFRTGKSFIVTAGIIHVCCLLSVLVVFFTVFIFRFL